MLHTSLNLTIYVPIFHHASISNIINNAILL